jgi:D-inositol-3-phosphate glycosyltransferase
MVSLHTSPLQQPGTGDAGGLNVYVVELARRLAGRGVAVDVFTRATRAGLPATVELAPGVLVRHVEAGPYAAAKEALPDQVGAFAAGMLRTAGYRLVHSHYWLSGIAAAKVARHWGVPLVHTMHTMARVKNAALAAGDAPEPARREAAEDQLARSADRLIANTRQEADDLVRLHHADPARVVVAEPGVDHAVFRPGPAPPGRFGLPGDALVVLAVGRIQPLKAPDLLLRAAARSALRDRLRIVFVGGTSGAGHAGVDDLGRLADELGLAGLVAFRPPVGRDELAAWYRAADLVAVPSHNESFGLVAAEAQACGTPVLAADVGGLRTVVRAGGVLVPGHDPALWAAELDQLLGDPERLARLGAAAASDASRFSWDTTAAEVHAAYQEVLR